MLYSDQERLGQFMRSMTGLSRGATEAVVEKFPWQKYETFVDIGTAEGGLPVQVALGHEHIKGRGFDLPVVQPIFDKYISSFNLEGRLCGALTMVSNQSFSPGCMPFISQTSSRSTSLPLPVGMWATRSWA